MTATGVATAVESSTGMTAVKPAVGVVPAVRSLMPTAADVGVMVPVVLV